MRIAAWLRDLKIARRNSYPERSEQFSVPKGVCSSISGQTLVLLHLATGVVFRSNSTGTAIWRAVASSHSVLDIAGRLSQEFGIPILQAERDVRAFVGELCAQGLLQPCEA